MPVFKYCLEEYLPYLNSIFSKEVVNFDADLDNTQWIHIKTKNKFIICCDGSQEQLSKLKENKSIIENFNIVYLDYDVDEIENQILQKNIQENA